MGSLLLTAVGAVAAPVGSFATGDTSPTAVYRALLTHAISRTSLPPGFSAARIVPTSPVQKARRHHAVGQVVVFMNVRGGGAEIDYVVFRTHADALAAVLPFPGASKTTTVLRSTPSSLPRPGQLSVSSRSVQVLHSKHSVWTTEVEFVDGNVAVSASTAVPSSSMVNDVPRAIRLARFAVERLHEARHA
jgi:hypothetical protein